MLWLETYLQGWNKTLVVVSHARSFLNNVCTDMLHMKGEACDAHLRGIHKTVCRSGLLNLIYMLLPMFVERFFFVLVVCFVRVVLLFDV